MMKLHEKTDRTYDRYHELARNLIAQYSRECPADDASIEYPERCLACADWFLGQTGRWSPAYTRQLSAALLQLVRPLGACELVDPRAADMVIDRLQNARPEPGRPRFRPRKSAKLTDIRRLERHLRVSKDPFDRWIAGYVTVATRIGWRPAELLDLRLDGTCLSAGAAKHTQGRGLCDRCEVHLNEYSPALLQKLGAWIIETNHWIEHYGNKKILEDVMYKRIRDASRKVKIRPLSLYVFRHVAISNMKASGYSREEIAVLINHKSTRTATEKYGKKRHGVRRARKRFGVSPLRLELVKKNARSLETTDPDPTP